MATFRPAAQQATEKVKMSKLAALSDDEAHKIRSRVASLCSELVTDTRLRLLGETRRTTLFRSLP